MSTKTIISQEATSSPMPAPQPATRFDKQSEQEESRDFGLLSAQPRVRILLPRVPGEKDTQPLEVFLNGVPYFLPKGVPLDVPEDIAQVLRHAGVV